MDSHRGLVEGETNQKQIEMVERPIAKDFAYYLGQNYLHDEAHGKDLEERKKSMKSFFADEKTEEAAD